MKKSLSIAMLAALLLSLTSLSAYARECGDFGTCTPVSACQGISQPGLYVLDGGNPNGGHLTFSSHECITVSAPNVTFALAFGGSIDGGGQGIGLHVLKTASNFVLTGDIGGSIENTAVGVQVDADGAKISSGGFDEPMSISGTIGILLNRVHGVSVAVGAGQMSMGGYTTAVMIKGGGDNSLGFPSTDHFPGWSGLFGPGVAVDVEHSRNNLIEGLYVFSGSGVVIGRGSSHNTVDTGFFQNGTVGVEIKRGAKHNTVTTNVSTSNQTDLLDDNRNCGTNIWTGDTFNTAAPSNCVQ
jgi:hypothetical protein